MYIITSYVREKGYIIRKKVGYNKNAESPADNESPAIISLSIYVFVALNFALMIDNSPLFFNVCINEACGIGPEISSPPLPPGIPVHTAIF